MATVDVLDMTSFGAADTISPWHVKLDAPVVCAPLKGGTDGRLPAPVDPSTLYRDADTRALSMTPSMRAEWHSDPVGCMRAALDTNVVLHARSDVGSRWCWPPDRLELLTDVATLCSDLDRDYLGGNCFSRLVVGPKGTGKSTFLQALALVTQYVSRRTIAVWCDVGLAHGAGLARSPLEVIAAAQRESLPRGTKLPSVLETAFAEANVERVLSIVHAMGLRLLIVLDEFPVVYSLQSPMGLPWVTQAYMLAQRASKPNTHVLIISGSAPYARAMVFGKLPVNADFPSYLGRACNLNSERCQVRVLGPLLDRLAFTAFVQGMTSTSTQKEAAMFVASGGVLRRLDDILRPRMRGRAVRREQNDYLFDVTARIGRHRELLLAMLHALQSRYETAGVSGSLLSHPWILVQWIPWSSFPPCLAEMSQEARYAAADDGAIVYEQSEAEDRVRFVSPLHAIILHERTRASSWPDWFDARARTALRYPYSVLGIEAEDVLRRSMGLLPWPTLAEKLGITRAHEVDGHGLRTLHVAYLHTIWQKKSRKLLRMTMQLIDDRGSSTPLCLHTSPMESLPLGTPLKESPDRAGADIVILQLMRDGAGTHTLCMHRFQVKLGVSVLGKQAAVALRNTMLLGAEAVAMYAQRHTLRLHLRLSLLTTRRCTALAMKALTDAGIAVLGADAVACLWSPCVSEWAASESLVHYVAGARAEADDDADDVDSIASATTDDDTSDGEEEDTAAGSV